uniref:RNA binding motif protein 5 n=1 Tax=Neolamprologus brichardi TaxID=32507 RepID=A0A3Q4GQF7_NEOBR
SDMRKHDPECYGKRSRDVEKDYDRRWVHDRYKDYCDERRDQDSPERSRKRRSSSRSDDEYDGDYPEQDYKMEQEEEEESKTIMLRGLPVHVTEDDMRTALEQLQGPQPVDIRLMKKRTGISRGFAFVEFYHLQDSTRWMETNQNKLVIQGKTIAVHYSNRKQKFENWLCNACGLYNFRKRLKCFRCGASKVGETSSSHISSIILRNIAPLSTVDGILNLLAPYANLSTNNVRLIKDKQTGQNRGFAFVQLSSPLEASQLLTILQSLQPPLKLDGKTVGVDFAKSARKDSVLPEGIRASALSVASTAIAAAQWSSSQRVMQTCGHSSLKDWFLSLEMDYLEVNKESLAKIWGGFIPRLRFLTSSSLSPAAPGMASVISASTAVVISQAAQVYHPIIISQPAVQVGTVPDTSTYQYDESSGYYYDPQTGLYYDPGSQYYYNSETQQYLYWDNEKQAYIPALSESGTNTEQASTASSAATFLTTGGKETKEKKEKPKNKSAQQIAKDMERWAKSLNKQKESIKSTAQGLGSFKDEDRKESAAADAGFSLFEKKIGSFEMPSLMTEQIKLEDEILSKSDLVAAYNGDSDPDENGSDRAADEEGKMTDWKRMVCLLCRRQFPTKDALLRHQQLSDLHKKNLEIERRAKLSETELEELERKEAELKYRDRAAERREKYGIPEPPAPKKKFYKAPSPTVNFEQPTKDGLTSDNIGSKMLQAMGWQEGKGLGRHQQGITVPISASLRTKGTGLGIKGSSYELSPSDTYKDAVRKAMFARFTEME